MLNSAGKGTAFYIIHPFIIFNMLFKIFNHEENEYYDDDDNDNAIAIAIAFAYTALGTMPNCFLKLLAKLVGEDAPTL